VLVDTHCHLNFDSFDKDRAHVILRAREIGVNRFLNPGIDITTSLAAVDLADKFEEIYASVGVHPNSSLSWNDDSLDQLKQMGLSSKVVAIGEIGLDYYRDYAPKDLQNTVFEEQLSLASELGLPVVIHNRDATDYTLDILEVWHRKLVYDHNELANRPGVLHSFSGDTTDARRATKINFYLGITGPITYKSSTDLRQVVLETPINNLLLETDAPFLTPNPRRGERNEPANIKLIAQKISELLDRPFEEVATLTTDNAQRLFQW
jgi:TatD DNase family protein